MTKVMFNEGFAVGARSFLEGFTPPEKINAIVEILRIPEIAPPTTGDDKEDFTEGFVMGVTACILASRVIQHKALAFDMALFWARSKAASTDDLWEEFNGVG